MSRADDRCHAPLVTVVIAVFNGVRTLEKAIRSVIGQTLHADLIVVDGGSTDGTVDLLRRYDHSIEYWISEADQGIYHALNKGIALARGEWLYFLGADDALAGSGVLARVFDSPHGSMFLYGNVSCAEANRIESGCFSKMKLTTRNICQQAVFYRRALFETLGYFDTSYPILADWAFNIKCFGCKALNARYIDATIAVYSLGGVSSNSVDDRFARDRLALIRKHLGFRYYLVARCGHFKDQLLANYRKYILPFLDEARDRRAERR